MILVVAEIEVEVVGELEREDVARVVGEDCLQVSDGFLELAARPCVECVEVAPLALGGAALGDGATPGLETRAGLDGERRHAEQHEETALHAVRERHLGIFGQGALQAVSGVEPEPQVLRQRRIEIADRRFARGGGLESACIQHRGSPSY